VEARGERAQRAARNALALGVPGLVIHEGEAPAALVGLTEPDAIFIGGGLTTPGLLAHCWEALRPGGRLVANAVTLEGEQVLTAARAEHGGELTRIALSHAAPVGGFTPWRAPPRGSGASPPGAPSSRSCSGASARRARDGAFHRRGAGRGRSADAARC